MKNVFLIAIFAQTLTLYSQNLEHSSPLLDENQQKASMQTIGERRYQDAWLFKKQRQEKYQKLFNALDPKVAQNLTAHILNPNAAQFSINPETLAKVESAIQKLQSSKKRFSWFSDDNFSGHLLKDLQNLHKKLKSYSPEQSNKAQKTLDTIEQMRRKNVIAQHQFKFNKINEEDKSPKQKKSSDTSNFTEKTSSLDSKRTDGPNWTSERSSSPNLEPDLNLKLNYAKKFALIDFDKKLEILNQKKLEINDAILSTQKKLDKLNKFIDYTESKIIGIQEQMNKKYATDSFSDDEEKKLKENKQLLTDNLTELENQRKPLLNMQTELTEKAFNLKSKITNTLHKKSLV